MYSGVDPLENEVAGARAVPNVMLSSSTLADNDFLYELYAIDLAGRYQPPSQVTPACTPDTEVLIGRFVRLQACYANSRTLRPNTPFQITLYWRTITRASEDYLISFQFYDSSGVLRGEYTAPPARADERYYYSTLFWDTAEYVQDRQTLTISGDVPAGEGYRLVIGMVRASDGTRLPITLDGVAAGDSYTLDMTFRVVP